MRCLTKVIPIIIIIVLLLSTSGAYATWKYAKSPLGNESSNIIFDMHIFEWEGSEELPDDEETGTAHAVLIDSLINGENIGLNTEDSYLNEQIAYRENRFGRDTLGSMAISQGTALEELFDLSTENVTFLIQMVSNNRYYIFTTSLDLGENGDPTYSIGSTISPIYRTTVVRTNGTWVATKTEEGSAKSAYYEESQYIFITRSQIPSFNPDTWTANN